MAERLRQNQRAKAPTKAVEPIAPAKNATAKLPNVQTIMSAYCSIFFSVLGISALQLFSCFARTARALKSSSL